MKVNTDQLASKFFSFMISGALAASAWTLKEVIDLKVAVAELKAQVATLTTPNKQ